MNDFDLGKIAISNSGLDAFLGDNPDLVEPVVASERLGGLQIRPKEYRFQDGYSLTGKPPQSDEEKEQGFAPGHAKINIFVRSREIAEKLKAVYQDTSLTRKEQMTATDKLVREDGKAPRKASGRIKVSSLAQLNGFVRCAEDALIHRSDRELWSLRKDAQGEFYIERMFDDSGAPLKG